MYNKKIMEYGGTTHNRIVCVPFGRVPQNTSRAAPFVVFCYTTFFCARKNATHFSLSGTKKRRIQPERYVQVLKLPKYNIN